MKFVIQKNYRFIIQRRIGYAGAITSMLICCLNMATGFTALDMSIGDVLTEPSVFVLVLLALASFTTSLKDSHVLRIMQVAAFIGYSMAAAVLLDPGGFHGAIFGVYGIILSIQYGLFKKKLYLKFGILLGIYGILNVVSSIRLHEYYLNSAPGIVILIGMFVYLFWVVFAEEIREYTRENTQLKEERDSNKVFVKFGRNISGVIHNLRSVLMSIDGYIDIQEQSEGDERHQLASFQKRATGRMLEMINNFMTAVRSYQQIENRRVPLNRLVQSAVEILKGNSELKQRFKIEVSLDDTDTIYAVPMEVMQVIDNVITNAAESMINSDKYHLYISTRAADGYVELAVKDEGSGIGFCINCTSKNCLSCSEFAFGRSTKPEGTGVGMMYVKQILTETKGRLQIESDASAGTTVHIYFPAPGSENVQFE